MLQIVDVSHAYGSFVSLREVSLELQAGEIVCLLGPSGCGKTTLLRIVAGLEAARAGTLRFDGADISAVPAHQRRFGLMFQDYALFPHMNVADNIAYGLKRQGLSKRQIVGEVEALLERVGLPGLGKRDIASLSGGQQQRVALARSLAPRPRLLMLDEPLGSLDAQLRDQLALELRAIIKDAGLSALYVTHDHREAYAIADRIAVMNIGCIEQAASPQALYRQPRRAFVARFLGLRNIFERERSPIVKRICETLMPPETGAKTVLIHPSGITLQPRAAGNSLRLEGKLKSAVFRGGHYDISVALDGDAELFFASPSLPAAPGDSLPLYIEAAAMIPLED